jgi:hypothetical protein
MSKQLPAPRDQLAGCIWLPRILTKARLQANSQLPSEYAARFCHPTGVDNQFLIYFNLTKEEILSLAALPDTEAAAAFLKRIGNQTGLIEKWNHIAVNLGRPGFPLAERLPMALATTYRHLPSHCHGLPTIFEVLEADETMLETSAS